MGFSDNTGATGLRGVMLLNPRFRGTYELQKVTQMGIQLRIYPELDAAGNPLPVRFGKRVEDVGNWVNGEHYGIQFLGGGSPDKEKVTMLVSIKGDGKIQDPSQRRGLRVWEQLRNTLYHRLEDGTAPQHWSRWASESRSAVFGIKQKSKAKPFAFMRGMMTWCMTQKGPLRTVSYQRPRLNCVFFCPPMAQNALVELVMAENAGAENLHTEDWDKVFRYNSKLVDLNTGCLINFGKPGQSNPAASRAAAGPQKVNFSGGNASDDNDDTFKVEGVVQEDAQCPVPIEVVRRVCHGTSWDDLLNVYENEKALVSALEVGFPDDLIVEAFVDFPEYLSDRLRAKREQLLIQQHQPAHGGFGPPYGNPQYGYAPPHLGQQAAPPQGAPQQSAPPQGAVQQSAPPQGAAQQSAPQQGNAPQTGGTVAVNFGGVTDLPNSAADDTVPFDTSVPANAMPAGTPDYFNVPPAATPDGGTNTGQPTGVVPQSVNDTMAQLQQAAKEAEEASKGSSSKPAG